MSEQDLEKRVKALEEKFVLLGQDQIALHQSYLDVLEQLKTFVNWIEEKFKKAGI